MDDEGDYEVDYEVDDTEEFPATLEVKKDAGPPPEPDNELELELEALAENESEVQDEPEPELDIAEQLEELELKQRKALKKRSGSSWKKPPTFVYASNFGFGINTYQTMIDYLDAKDAGHRVDKDAIHLPLLEERCLRQYEAERPFRWYDNNDIDQYIHKGEKIRTQIRQNDAVGVGNVLRRTHTNWSMTRKWMQLLKNSNVLDYRNAHKKDGEFDGLAYRAPSPVGSVIYSRHTPSPAAALGYHGSALTPKSRYLDDLTAELASVLVSLVQSRVEQEQAMAQRRTRLQELDNTFDNTLDAIYTQMSRLGSRPEPPPPVRQLHLSDLDVSARNKIRRAEELRDMMDGVNELTSLNSTRNMLRDSMRSGGVDNDILALGDRVENMNNLLKNERMKDVASDYEIDLLRAEIAGRRANPTYPDRPYSPYRSQRGSNTPGGRPVQLSAIDHLSCRPRETLVRDDVISDVTSRVLRRAGEMTDPSEEKRRINDRARYINLTRRLPNTGDTDLRGVPSRTERNIDHMARTLASRGTCQRRYDVDDEGELPYAGPFPTTRIYQADTSVSSLLERPPSPSRKVRTASSRALARTSLLGY